MRELLEAAFEYTMDHPESLMIISGVFLAIVSVFTAAFDISTTSFLRVLVIGLLVSGVLLYVLRLGLRFIIRVGRKLFSP
jgi:type III secretory pathway component EscR